MSSLRVFSRWLLEYRLSRFIVAGGSTVFVHIVVLFVLTHLFGLWYIASSTLAFILAFIVGFWLQKFWTFRDEQLIQLERQLAVYFGLSMFNLVANSVMMYWLVDGLGLWYLLAQLITVTVIAGWNFFIYTHLIFR